MKVFGLHLYILGLTVLWGSVFLKNVKSAPSTTTAMASDDHGDLANNWAKSKLFLRRKKRAAQWPGIYWHRRNPNFYTTGLEKRAYYWRGIKNHRWSNDFNRRNNFKLLKRAYYWPNKEYYIDSDWNTADYGPSKRAYYWRGVKNHRWYNDFKRRNVFGLSKRAYYWPGVKKYEDFDSQSSNYGPSKRAYYWRGVKNHRWYNDDFYVNRRQHDLDLSKRAYFWPQVWRDPDTYHDGINADVPSDLMSMKKRSKWLNIVGSDGIKFEETPIKRAMPYWAVNLYQSPNFDDVMIDDQDKDSYFFNDKEVNDAEDI